MNTHSLYTSFVGKLLAIIVLTLFAWGNAWADVWSDGGTLAGNQTVSKNITIPSGKTVVIDGDLTINANTTLTVRGNLIVKGNITMSGSGAGKRAVIDMQGANVVCGTWKTDGSMQCVSGGTINLNNYSEIKNSSGTSYLKAYNVNHSVQSKMSYSNGTMNIIVTGKYSDNSNSGDNRLWGVYLVGPLGYRSVTSAGAYELYVRNNVNIAISEFVFTDGDRLVRSSNVVSVMKTDGVNKASIQTQWTKQASLLPIELTSFTALQDGEEIEIAWTTNSEVNNDYFTVEYSIDGVSFKTLETVAGSGTTSEVNEYAITTEVSRFNGVVYFRLKQTDYNGEYSYSDVITLAVESSNELYVYPNPAVEFVSVSGTYKTAIVQDMFGKKVACATNGEQIFVGNLSVGTYYVVVATENGKKVLPFVKE